MTQWVKYLPFKAEDPHKNGRREPTNLFSDLHMWDVPCVYTLTHHTNTHAHTNTENIYIYFNFCIFPCVKKIYIGTKETPSYVSLEWTK